MPNRNQVSDKLKRLGQALRDAIANLAPAPQRQPVPIPVRAR